MAFLLLLDRPTPVERAVFLLHDVFDYDDEIAAIVGNSETNCRQIARLLTGVGRDMGALDLLVERRDVNGQPGGLVGDPDGRLINVFLLDVTEGVVGAVRSVINPDKQRHLGPLADIPKLRQRRTEPS